MLGTRQVDMIVRRSWHRECFTARLLHSVSLSLAFKSNGPIPLRMPCCKCFQFVQYSTNQKFAVQGTTAIQSTLVPSIAEDDQSIVQWRKSQSYRSPSPIKSEPFPNIRNEEVQHEQLNHPVPIAEYHCFDSGQTLARCTESDVHVG